MLGLWSWWEGLRGKRELGMGMEKDGCHFHEYLYAVMISIVCWREKEG